MAVVSDGTPQLAYFGWMFEEVRNEAAHKKQYAATKQLPIAKR